MKKSLHFSKPAFWITVAALIAILAAVGYFLLTNHADDSKTVLVRYEETLSKKADDPIEDDEVVIYVTHYQTADGLWHTEDGFHDEYTYQYRLLITGRLHGVNQDTTYIVLSNREDVTFDETWRASGLSSNTEDYFKPEDAVIVGVEW